MTDEEGKASDIGFDMSDIISSDCTQETYINHEGSI